MCNALLQNSGGGEEFSDSWDADELFARDRQPPHIAWIQNCIKHPDR
jgi:hypothetical protein